MSRTGDLTSIQSRLEQLPRHLDNFFGTHGDNAFDNLFSLHDLLHNNATVIQSMYDAVNEALAVPPPPQGAAASVGELAVVCDQVARQCSDVASGLGAVASAGLPAAWTGPAAELAARAVGGQSAYSGAIHSVLQQAVGVLSQWLADLLIWNNDDQRGVRILESSFEMMKVNYIGGGQSVIDVSCYEDALSAALKGVAARIDAASAAAQAAEKTGKLADLVGTLHAARFVGGDVTPLSAVVLAATAYQGTLGSG